MVCPKGFPERMGGCIALNRLSSYSVFGVRGKQRVFRDSNSLSRGKLDGIEFAPKETPIEDLLQ